MTKEKYYEMCELLNAEPIDEEIPIEFEDFDLDTQQAFTIYNMLQDSWDYMSGNYHGKNYSGIIDIMELNNVDDKKIIYDLIKRIDHYRSIYIQSKNKQKPSS